MELWDGYYIDGSPAGTDLIRGEPIPDGLYHLVCEVIVRHSDGDFLLMQRDLKKNVYPGFWEAGASGGVIKGETALEGAMRELFEETGIKDESLTPLGNYLNDSHPAIHVDFLCVTDFDKSSITLQKGETTDFRWMSSAEFKSFMEGSECIREQGDRVKQLWDKL